MKNWKKALVICVAMMAIFSVSAMAAPKHWVVGFSQIGSESEWRTADTVSVQNAFLDDPSFTLIYSDAQQKQENQIKAIRSFIARKVDAILFTALVETGYGPVLQEAKKAKIPVVMIDRDVAEADQQYRLTIMGSDLVKEGEKAGMWLATNLKKHGYRRRQQGYRLRDYRWHCRLRRHGRPQGRLRPHPCEASELEGHARADRQLHHL